jgi:adenine-specific DNA-methyltransferase
MPDVILYYEEKNWLILVESVTSHGSVDGKRRNDLTEIFKTSSAGLVYVTAFPLRQLLARYISSIAWETEVWCTVSETHLIHLNSSRFLGPYSS